MHITKLTAIVVALAFLASGCGGVGHYAAGVAAHHATNHFVHSAQGQRRVNKVFCIYHGHRFLVDVRHHHLIGAGLNAYSAFKACKRGFFNHH